MQQTTTIGGGRNSNLELLRIVCILFITAMHCFSQIEQPLAPINQFLGICINSIGNIGVSCFILISGYFEVKQSWTKLLHLTILTTICSIIVYIINNGLHFNSEFIKAALAVPMYSQWFISCYLAIIIFSPYINSFAISLSQKKYNKFLIICFVLFSLIPSIFVFDSCAIIADGGKNFTYFIFLYMVGRYMNIYNITFPNNFLIRIIVIIPIITTGLNCIAKYIGLGGYYFSKDCSPLILVLSIAIFSLMSSIQYHNKFINYVAKSVLSIYLLNNIRFFVDRSIISWSNRGEQTDLILFFSAGILFISMAAVIFDKIRIWIFDKYENKLIELILKLSRKGINVIILHCKAISGIIFKWSGQDAVTHN